MNFRIVVASLVLGIIGNIMSAALLDFDSRNVPIATIAVSFAVLFGLFLCYTLYRLYLLRAMGIKGWEAGLSSGTSTRDCVARSQRSIDFLGIASTKWNREGANLRRMLVRHASNGGKSRFLLLNPSGQTCRRFEMIKNVPVGTLSKQITENAQALLCFAETGLPLEIRFYDENPRFRISLIDGDLLMLGIYSYVTDSGEDTPQLVLDGAPRTWSFFFAFSSHFEHLWASAHPANDVLAMLATTPDTAVA